MCVRVTTVVVNWNLREKTLRCLQSLKRQSIQSSVILVDNGSTDGSAPFFSNQDFADELIQFSENRGFAKACNAAIRLALSNPDCEYILLLNNDAVLQPDALDELLRVADGAHEAGILGPKIYDMDYYPRLWYAGARRRRFVLAATDTGRGEEDFGQYDRLGPVDYVFGAAMLIRRDVFLTIGLFDERFFLYLEDLDFCLRAQKAGFSILFVPQAHVLHYGSASTEGNRAMRQFYLIQSSLGFLRKHCTATSSVLILLYWLAVFIRDLTAHLINGNWHLLRASVSGLFGGLPPGR
jgi:GT2 family glycosyltransferase